MSKGTIVALVGGAAALVVVAFFWGSAPDSAGDRDTVAARRRVHDERGGDAGTARERRSGARSGSESRGGSARSNDRMAREDGGSARKRLPPAIGGGTSGSAASAGSGRSHGEMDSARSRPAGRIARPPAGREDDSERDRPELPEASDRAPDQEASDDVVEPPKEPIREVAFEGGDRLFDTGVPMEVKDAGRISGDGGVVSLWIQPEWAHNKEDSADLMRLGESGLQLLKEGSFLRFQYTDANGNEQGGDADIGQWNDGEWHHVIASWTDGAMSLYVDGGQAFQNQGLPRPPAQSDPGLFVGSVFPEGTGIALAQMSQVTVLNRIVSQDDIKKMFEAGAPVRK